MTLRHVTAVAGVECSKLFAQLKVRLLFAVCLVAPFGFAVIMLIQSSLPTDTLFGRAVKDSGLAVSLVILGFAALWGLPVVSSVAGGDVFSAEDRYNTWKTILTRSRTRLEILTGKLVAAAGVSVGAVIVLALSSGAAGILVVGAQPIVGLSGVLLSAPDASARIGLAWLSVLPPVLALTAVAMAVSIVTRNSAAGDRAPGARGARHATARTHRRSGTPAPFAHHLRVRRVARPARGSVASLDRCSMRCS